MEKLYAKFRILPYGARFKYDDRKYDNPLVLKKVWVKIGPNQIAEWDASQMTTNWVGQQLCCFTDAYKDEDNPGEDEVLVIE